MATLKELSERTGYSAATISRVLNADPTFSVPEKVRRKILDEAGKTNYSGTRSGRGRRLNLCSELVWQKCLHLKSS